MNFPLSVTAPLSDFAIAAPVVGGEVLHASGKAGRIMIVDDEIANVLVAKKYLERAGYRSFETTTDSSTALNLIFSTKPDVLLLDINMPEIDGIQILKEIRSRNEFRRLPVLILTANNEAAVKLACLELGATDFLVKPVDPMELAPRVRNALQTKVYEDQLQNYAAILEEKVQQRTRELEHSRSEKISMEEEIDMLSLYLQVEQDLNDGAFNFQFAL